MGNTNGTSDHSYQASPSTLYEGLKNLDTRAICYLHQKTGRHLATKKYLAHATVEDAEELANDAVLLTLQKILNGSYTFQGFSPLTFALVIADNLLRNFCRKKRIKCEALEGLQLPEQAELEDYLQQKVLELRIKKALDSLDETSRLLIHLKYFDTLSDAEIIARKLTPYTTTDSLKSKRCACMRKLKQVLRESTEW